MNEFLDKLLKIQSDYFKRMQLLFILDLISIFCILIAIFYFFLRLYIKNYYPDLPVDVIFPILALAIGLTGALLKHRNDHKKNVTLLIEDKYTDLKEKLRTAYDNRDETNIIVESLKNLVLNGLDAVSASKLIASSVVIINIVITIIFITVAATVSLNPQLGIPPDDVAKFAGTIGGTMGNLTNETITSVTGVPEDSNKAGRTGSGYIFGQPKIAPVEGKPVDLALEMGGGVGNVPKDYNPEQNQFIRSAAFPVDVLGSNVSDGGYSILMKKSETEKELINKYAVERSKI